MTSRPTALNGAEKFWYVFINIITLGGLYFVKIAMKKALAERAADEIIRREEMRGQLRVEPKEYNPDRVGARPLL